VKKRINSSLGENTSLKGVNNLTQKNPGGERKGRGVRGEGKGRSHCPYSGRRGDRNKKKNVNYEWEA